MGVTVSPFGGMATSNPTSVEKKENSVETATCPTMPSKPWAKGASSTDDSSKNGETSTSTDVVLFRLEASTKASKNCTKGASSNSTDVVLFQPEARLNPDVLELIFRHLNFKELLAAELVCKQWKGVVDARRLYKQLARKICARKVNIGVTRTAFQKQLRDVRRGRFKKKNKS